MKKIIKTILVTSICFSMVACAENKKTDTNENSTKEVVSLAGSYQDSTSQRASAQVEQVNENEIKIDITWSSSATEYDEWIINAKISDGKASYDSITHNRVSFVDDQETTEELNDYGPGYFEIDGEKLLWTGSGNSQTSTCVFELMK